MRFNYIVLAIVIALVLAFATKSASAQDLPGMTLTPVGPYGQGGLAATYYYAPPRVMYIPRIQYQPYVYRGSTYTPRTYHTPVRNHLFGRGTYRSYWSPMTLNGSSSK